MKRAKEKEAQEAVGVATADRRRLTLALELVPGLKGVWLERQPLLLHPMRRELGEELRSAVDCRAERQLAVQAALRALEERLTAKKTLWNSSSSFVVFYDYIGMSPAAVSEPAMRDARGQAVRRHQGAAHTGTTRPVGVRLLSIGTRPPGGTWGDVGGQGVSAFECLPVRCPAACLSVSVRCLCVGPSAGT